MGLKRIRLCMARVEALSLVTAKKLCGAYNETEEMTLKQKGVEPSFQVLFNFEGFWWVCIGLQ